MEEEKLRNSQKDHDEQYEVGDKGSYPIIYQNYV